MQYILNRLVVKLWLHEILACPIDKHYPLKLKILQWQGEGINYFSPPNPIKEEHTLESFIAQGQKKNSDLIQELINQYRDESILPDKKEDQLVKLSPDNLEAREEWLVNDSLIIKPMLIDQYLTELIDKITELTFVEDKSTWVGTNALNLIQNEINQKLKTHLDSILKIENINNLTEIEYENQILKPVRPALEFLNRFKYEMEIEEAALYCSRCKRWYPVFETIPQMLPDEVRNSTSDQAFHARWENKIDFE